MKQCPYDEGYITCLTVSFTTIRQAPGNGKNSLSLTSSLYFSPLNSRPKQSKSFQFWIDPEDHAGLAAGQSIKALFAVRHAELGVVLARAMGNVR